jgi:cytochrome c553
MVDNDRRRIRYGCIAAAALIAMGCGRQPTVSGAAPPAAVSEAYAPGLGELMTLQQMRHVKLWLAGRAGNWELAAYELDELDEGFDDVVKLHPTHKDSPVAPKDAVPRMMTQPLADLRAAVTAKDGAAFARSYDALTDACNRCHEATNFGFNRVQRPDVNPYPNQDFSPPKK